MISAFCDVAPKALSLLAVGGALWALVARDERRLRARETRRMFAGNRRPVDRSAL